MMLNNCDRIEITDIDEKEYPLLLPIWEASVRATHEFLEEGDLQFYKECIGEDSFWKAFRLRAIRCNDEIQGFAGVEGDRLEVLFLHPSARGKGYGKQLLDDVVRNYGVSKVDVNEQNRQGVGFYLHYGFIQQGRSPLDGMGKPYPLLHLELPSPALR